MVEEKRIKVIVGPHTSTETIVINHKQTLKLDAPNCYHSKIISANNKYKYITTPFTLEIHEEDSDYYICLQCLKEFMDKELIMDNS